MHDLLVDPLASLNVIVYVIDVVIRFNMNNNDFNYDIYCLSNFKTDVNYLSLIKERSSI